jgi:putative transposase
LLYRVMANLAQRAAERSYGLADTELTPALSWHRFGLERLLREHRDQWLPWWSQMPSQVLDVSARQLATALGRFSTGQGRFPVFKKKHGPAAGVVPITFKESGTISLTDGGRVIRLPLPRARRRELGPSATKKLATVRVVKDNRARRAAQLVRDGQGQVQTVTYSFTGGHWWAAIRLRVLLAYQTRSNRRRAAVRAPVAGLDAGMGRLFATLNTPVTGVTDGAGHIAAPAYLRRALADLGQAQRSLQRTTNGSHRHSRALARVQKLHGRVGDRRATFHQQLAIAVTEYAPLVGGVPQLARHGPTEEGLSVWVLGRRCRIRYLRRHPHPAGRQTRERRGGSTQVLPEFENVLGLWGSENQTASGRPRV